MTTKISKKKTKNGKTMDNQLIVRDEKGKIVSGVLNPKGMTVGTKHFNTKYKEALHRIALEENISDLEQIDTEMVYNLVKDARKGNFNAVRLLMSYRFGMPVAQNLNINLSPEKDKVIIMHYPQDDIAYVDKLIAEEEEKLRQKDTSLTNV